MRQADAQKTAVLLYIQMFGQVQSVVVAIPSEEAAPPQLGGQLQRGVARNAYRYCGTTRVESLRIGDAVNLESGNFQEPCDEPLDQDPLVPLNSPEGGEQGGAAAGQG